MGLEELGFHSKEDLPGRIILYLRVARMVWVECEGHGGVRERHGSAKKNDERTVLNGDFIAYVHP